MKEKAGSENALPFLISTTYCGSGILTKSCVTCYPYSIFENPKSYDMQNIHAILTEKFKVMTMARLFFARTPSARGVSGAGAGRCYG